MVWQEFHSLLLGLLVIGVAGPAVSWWRRQQPAATVVQTRRWQCLSDAMSLEGDNFLLLRLIAASAVIYGHSYAISGIPDAGDHIARLGLGYGLYSGSIAVDIFFAMSGFLVAGSWQRRPSVGAFLGARALRILPGYFVCLVATAIVVGGIYTSLPLVEYLGNPQTRTYVTTNLQFATNMQWTLPGVFTTNPLPETVNGSIWTLPGEVRVYALLALFGVLGILEKRHRLLVTVAAMSAMAVFASSQLPIFAINEFVKLAGWFALGALFYAYREDVPLHGAIALALIGSAYFVYGTDYFLFAFAAATTYSCLWFAYRPKMLLGFNRFGDYSYGVYLWGYPVQQVVTHHMNVVTPFKICIISFPIALLIGIASWHLVEKPALRLKSSRKRQKQAKLATADANSESYK